MLGTDAVFVTKAFDEAIRLLFMESFAILLVAVACIRFVIEGKISGSGSLSASNIAVTSVKE